MSINSGSSFGRNGKALGQRNKPWHVQATIEDLHKKMKGSVGEWLDAYFKTVAPEPVYEQLLNRTDLGLAWLKENQYKHDHRRIRFISDFRFAMEFDLYKGDVVVNKFDFIVAHDGGFKEPHKIAMMIYTGVGGR